MKLARVGVLFDNLLAEEQWNNREDVFAIYIKELLQQAGISFEWIDSHEHLASTFDVVLLALMNDSKEAAKEIEEFANNGGVVISMCQNRHLALELGYTIEEINSPGYAHVAPFSHVDIPLRYLKGTIWKKDSTGENVQLGKMTNFSPNGSELGAALVTSSIEKGMIDHWNVNIMETIVGIQQGTDNVERDGKPALDGSGNINDGILKADDGFELDWEFDRLTTVTDRKYFAYPYADLWREVFIGHLLSRIVEKGMTLPFIGYWPEDVDQVATISFDSDLNSDESAQKTLEILKQEDVQTTWCMIEPGYSQHVYPDVKRDGHELAFHFNALERSGGKWTQDSFDRQLNTIKDKTGLNRIYSNKNHYTRFEGWGDLFEWCEQSGIELDQTKGPSKPGNIGFIFGTCQPYFPVALHDKQNRSYNVLEVGFLSQDLGHPNFSDTSIIEPFLETVKRVNGVAHFLFHQIHILEKDSVSRGIVELIRTAKQKEFQFWTSYEINNWMRKRRTIKINSIDDEWNVSVTNPKKVEKAVTLIPIFDDTTNIKHETIETHFGIRCIRRKIEVNERLMMRGK